MEVDETPGSRAQFLVRLQRFMDMTLEQLNTVLKSKDAADSEIRSTRNALLKITRIWEKATADSTQSQIRES